MEPAYSSRDYALLEFCLTTSLYLSFSVVILWVFFALRLYEIVVGFKELHVLKDYFGPL